MSRSWRWWALPLLLLCGCPGPSGSERVVLNAPPPETFGEVGDMLGAHCGSLDCHGSRGRNLIVYNINGLRLDPKDTTGGDIAQPGTTSTTDAERIATYESVLGLEPELLAQVLSEGGAAPERLTLVRKARGAEHHKGGSAVLPGSGADRCLVTWLTGTADCTETDDPRYPAPPPLF